MPTPGKQNLNVLLNKLASDKVKERTEAIQAVEHYFTNPHNVANFYFVEDDDGKEAPDPKVWDQVYQSLLVAVQHELEAYRKKAKTGDVPPVVHKRLESVGSTLRKLIELSAPYMNYPLIKKLVEKLLGYMEDKRTGTIFKPLALDSIKSLKALLSHQAHLDHLSEDAWNLLMGKIWNCVLGDNVSTQFLDDDWEEVRNPNADTSKGKGKRGRESEDEGDSDGMDVYEDDEDTDDRNTIAGTPSVKRRRTEDQNTPRSAQANRTQRTPAPDRRPLGRNSSNSIQVQPEQLECAAILALLLRSPCAPILAEWSYEEDDGDSGKTFSSSLLHRFVRFLDMYPTDSSMHDDFLSALSSSLVHLSVNRKDEVEVFARRSWNSLVNLWGTKNKRMKENLTIILRILFPFLIASGNDNAGSPIKAKSEKRKAFSIEGFDWIQGIAKLYNMLHGEADNRWGVEPLTLDVLRLEAVPPIPSLGLSSSNSEGAIPSKWATEASLTRVFVAKTFRAGRTFEASHALTWALLELQADCAAQLFKISESAQSFSSRPKYRENPITALLKLIAGGPASVPISQAKIVYQLQTLLFIIERHWRILHDKLRQEVTQTLLQALGGADDGPIQSWMLMCLAAVAHLEVSKRSVAIPQEAPTNIQQDIMASQFQSQPQFILSSGLLGSEQSVTPFDWDALWTHSIRRVNLPTVCRAASHTAYILIMNWGSPASSASATPPVGATASSTIRPLTSLLSTQKVLSEIETLGKDLDVQGPSYPYDSVCYLLSQCLKIANQDARLFRMRLEDKVLAWLLESWKIVDANSVFLGLSDALMLLENVCGLTLKNVLGTTSERGGQDELGVLQECSIVRAMSAEFSERVIRDYILEAKLPPWVYDTADSNTVNAAARIEASTVGAAGAGAVGDPSSAGTTGTLVEQTLANDSMFYDIVGGSSTPTLTPVPSNPQGSNVVIPSRRTNLIQPRPRERLVSSFFVQSLESLIAIPDGTTTTQSSSLSSAAVLPNAKNARRYLDTAITALCFETLLINNGYEGTKRVIQLACKMISKIVNWVVSGAGTPSSLKWSMEDNAHVLEGLLLLVDTTGEEDRDGADWQALVPPGEYSGIRLQTLRRLTNAFRNSHESQLKAKKVIQLRALWQNSEVATALMEVTKRLRTLLHDLIDEGDEKDQKSMEVDEDGFGAIRTGNQDTTGPFQDTYYFRLLVRTCVEFLSVGPVLRYSSSEPIRDTQLVQLGCKSLSGKTERFIPLWTLLLRRISQGTFSLTQDQAITVFSAICDLQSTYTYGKNESFHLLVIQLLTTTMESWLKPLLDGDTDDDEVLQMLAYSLLGHFVTVLARRRAPSWRVRNQLALLFNQVLSRAPGIETDLPRKTENSSHLLKPCLLEMADDRDVRVRFRLAVSNASLLTIAEDFGLEKAQLYGQMKSQHSTALFKYENIATRILSLGNIMVISSAVRRGAYWHLLETCAYTSIYNRHIEAMLLAIAQRLGLDSLANFSEVFANHLAYSIQTTRQPGEANDVDLLNLPPRLLGYDNKKECAEALFKYFTPINITFGDSEAYEKHAKAVQKSSYDGIRECLGTIVGYHVAGQLSTHQDLSSREVEANVGVLLGIEVESLRPMITQHVDAIAVSMLRVLGDQNGPNLVSVRIALQERSSASVDVLNALSKYRQQENLKLHESVPPHYDVDTILKALDWLYPYLPDHDTKSTTYHVLHELFSEIHRSPLVNEQIRMIDALSLWISLHHKDFSDITLLHTLVHGMASLLSQLDLVRSSQSMLEWAFGRYVNVKDHDPRLADVLIQIACLAHDYRANDLDHELGAELEQWIDKQTVLLSKSNEARPQILNALLAWPHQLPPRLSQLEVTRSVHQTSAVLADHTICMNKFRLVRRLRDDALREGYPSPQWAKLDFWRLKEYMPVVNQLQLEDADAFACLLILNKGFIDTYCHDQPTSTSRTRLRRGVKRGGAKKGKDPWDDPRESTVLSLLIMLEESSIARAHTAYETLRLIMSVPAHRVTAPTMWPSTYRRELAFLEHFPRIPRPAAQKSLKNLSTELYRTASANFPRWIALVTTLFADVLSGQDEFWAQLKPILKKDTPFAEETLPYLVQTLLVNEPKTSRDNITAPRVVLSQYFSIILESPETNVFCLRSIVDVVLHMRNCTPLISDTLDKLAYDKWLSIDYTLLAKSAIQCGAYTTALLFLELAKEYYSPDALDAAVIENALYEIYSHIDEPDGFYGVQTQDLHKFLLKRFHHEGQWEKAFRFHGAALEVSRKQPTHTEGLLQSFHSFGFDRLAMETLSSSSDSIEASTMSYRLGWRTETWDLPDCAPDAPGVPIYSALRAIHRERDNRRIDQTVQLSLLQSLNRLRTLGPENLAEIRDVAQDVMCLYQIVQFRGEQFQKLLCTKETNVEPWQGFIDVDPAFEFSALENILATRISLIRSVRQREERHMIGSMTTPFIDTLLEIEKRSLLRLAVAAREANQIQIALNSVIRAQKLDCDQSFSVGEEFADVLWLQKEEKLAIQYLQSMLKAQDTPTRIPQEKRALALARLGSWTSRACLEAPRVIHSQFFSTAARSLSGSSPETRGKVHHEWAAFAEKQYHAILNSPEMLRLKVYMDRKKIEINLRQAEYNRNPNDSFNKYEAIKAQKLLEADQEAFKQHNASRDTFLEAALVNYSRCLRASDEFDDDVPLRLCSLWFANFDESTLHSSQQLEAALNRVPSRKFLFLAHQLSARLSPVRLIPDPKPKADKKIAIPSEPAPMIPASARDTSQQSLQRLILRMCQEHPFHTLYQLFSIRSEFSDDNNRPRRSQAPTSAERAATAKEIFDKVKEVNPVANDVLKICWACLEWAKFPIKGKSEFAGSNPQVPQSVKIMKVREPRVPVITYHTPIDNTLRYDNCVWIDRYEQNFKTAGGVNLPKISVCLGTDGNGYTQLFKGEGNDDMRQDAVMEQVFELVNRVLCKDRQTRRRELKVRDYKVIPLGAQAGLLEFVGNTTPLGGWLNKAHPLYNPQDPSISKMRERFKENQNASHDPQKVAEGYLELKKKFHPVMRHYFTEKHKNPVAWFAMRLNYTRSVATTSIVGHILGLGDRHVSNILLDGSTGEVVHIDLGIAFDQGKLLTVPELVPFRMTDDMVDGMGSSGTQGVFQRCAEETLRVLRERSETIMTVLEVFKHDPLHSWTVSDIKRKRVQSQASTMSSEAARYGMGAIGIDMESGGVEEAADRALSGVARKLDKSLSVEYTVNQLIAEARDPVNLGAIFVGWSPWC